MKPGGRPAGGRAATSPAGLPARRAAMEVLLAVRQGEPFDNALARALASLPDADRRLAHELAAGVLRRQSDLDARLIPARAAWLGQCRTVAARGAAARAPTSWWHSTASRSRRRVHRRRPRAVGGRQQGGRLRERAAAQPGWTRRGAVAGDRSGRALRRTLLPSRLAGRALARAVRPGGHRHADGMEQHAAVAGAAAGARERRGARVALARGRRWSR